MADKPIRIPPELEDVVNQVGEFIEYWGFKNVHGRIWVHLFLADEPLDAADLIERLGISKALVSMSISDLIDYDVIQVAGKSARGTTLYRANTDVTTVITNVLRKRERRLLSRISSASRLLKELPENSRGSIRLSSDRIQVLVDMVRAAEQSLDGMLQMTDVNFDCWSTFNDLKDPKPSE